MLAILAYIFSFNSILLVSDSSIKSMQPSLNAGFARFLLFVKNTIGTLPIVFLTALHAEILETTAKSTSRLSLVIKLSTEQYCTSNPKSVSRLALGQLLSITNTLMVTSFIGSFLLLCLLMRFGLPYLCLKQTFGQLIHVITLLFPVGLPYRVQVPLV